MHDIHYFPSDPVTVSETSTGLKIRLPARSLQLKSHVEFDIDSDEENVCEIRYSKRNPPDPSKYILGRSGRAIAGSKRVAKHNGGLCGSEQILQSITATPAYSNISFEEMRMEYYQAHISCGRSQPVDPIKTPWAVIPSDFHAVHVAINDHRNVVADDVTMNNASAH